MVTVSPSVMKETGGRMRWCSTKDHGDEGCGTDSSDLVVADHR